MAVRGPWWTNEAVLALDGLVDGPVHPPHSTDAAVELALDPGQPLLSRRRLLAVVGATGTADVVRVLGWAAEYDIELAVLDAGEHRGRPGDRPVVAISLSRADRVVADPDTGTVRAGVGASWAAVHRAAGEVVARPRATLCRSGTVGSAIGGTTLRGATVVTGDGAVHSLPGGECTPELWWAFRARPGAVGVVTAVVVDARSTTPVLPRSRTTSEDLFRLVHLARRHDPAGLLGVPR